MLKCYVDDYISLAIPTSQAQLIHVANGVADGVHNVFPANNIDANDPLSEKKLKKQEGQWAMEKDCLGLRLMGT